VVVQQISKDVKVMKWICSF